MNPLRALFLSLSRTPPAIMLLSIIGLAVVVTLMVTQSIDNQKRVYDEKERQLHEKLNAKGKVVYVIKDVAEGQTIPSEALEERDVELAKVPLDAITSSSLAAGRVAKYGISSGNIISQHDLAQIGRGIGFEARLKEGMRAVTFAVDTNTGVAGFVEPESHIDIISMVGSGAETKASPILSDVEVIAVGQMYQRNPSNTTAVPASSVTVAVSPEDTTKLIKAISASKLYLSLRHEHDHSPVATVDVTSLYAKAPSAQQGQTAIAQLVPSLPPPPLEPSMQGDTSMPGLSVAMPSAQQPPKPLHEIEIWSGSKKDVLSVAAQ